jgi:hypothetical protein
MEYNDFKSMPVIHGGYNLKEDLESILSNGLRVKSTSNITNVDRLVQKENCVFFRYGQFCTYGNGEILIVDPQVVVDKQTKIFEQDVEGVYNEIRKYLLNPSYRVQQYTKNLPAVRREFIDIFQGQDVNRFLESAWFVNYLKSYSTDWSSLVTTFVSKFKNSSATLCDFFNRHPFDLEWNINEEICIPESVEPKYILAYWDKTNFYKFRDGIASETQQMLRVMERCLAKNVVCN